MSKDQDEKAFICPECDARDPDLRLPYTDVGDDHVIIKPQCQTCDHIWEVHYDYSNVDTKLPGDPPTPTFYTVCLVLHDKAFGGPEEGGWWYDTYEPQLDHDSIIPVICRSRAGALNAEHEMILACDRFELNEGRPPVSSVNSIGRYEVYVFEGLPTYLPKERQHYE